MRIILQLLHSRVDHAPPNSFLRNLQAVAVLAKSKTNECCCTKARWFSACIAKLTYGSVSKWCITKADIWLSQIGPDTQSRQLRDSLQRKIPSWDFFFVIYFLVEGDMHVGISNNFWKMSNSKFKLPTSTVQALSDLLTYQVMLQLKKKFDLN